MAAQPPTDPPDDTPSCDEPVLDPRVDDLPFRRFVQDWAAARGITTVRQLARVHPTALFARTTNPEGSPVVEETRIILERFLGRTWEELVANAEPAAPPRIDDGPRRPTGWDELRLALPAPLRALPLEGLVLPARILAYTQREALTTLGGLARRSEAVLLGGRHIGRLSIHRTYLAVLALAQERPSAARRRPGPGAPPPPRVVAPPEAARDVSDLLGAWRALVDELPREARVVMTRHAGFDGPAETYEAIAASLGESTPRARQHEVNAIVSLRRAAWMTEVRRRFAAALPGRPVPLATLARDPWWSRIAASPELLDYFAFKLLGGDADVVELRGAPHLARGRARRAR